MPGAAESSLCISEKCCYEWSHAYSALVDVMTEWGVTKWSVTVLTHNSMHLPIFTRRDRAPRTEHNKIKHIQAACCTGWGSSVMERNAGAKTTVMDLHLHESCSFPPCIFRQADWSCAMSQIKSTLAWEWARGSQEVVEKNSTWLVAGPNKANKLWVLTVQFLWVSPVSRLCCTTWCRAAYQLMSAAIHTWAGKIEASLDVFSMHVSRHTVIKQ